MKRVKNILELIGATPVVRLNRVVDAGGAEVWGKLESANPAGSVKDRIALAMVEEAEAAGLLQPGGTIIEPTSGNTGIGLAMVAAVKGYRLIVTMFDTASRERRLQMQAYGAEVVLTPAEAGMRGAVEKAMELQRTNPDYFLPQQFLNPANPGIHQRTTGQELLTQMDGEIDVLVAGVGTGGSVTGIGRALKEALPQVRVIAVEPVGSPVLSGGEPGFSYIEGIGPVLCRRCSILRCTTKCARSTTTMPTKWRGVWPVRKGCWSGFRPAPTSTWPPRLPGNWGRARRW